MDSLPIKAFRLDVPVEILDKAVLDSDPGSAEEAAALAAADHLVGCCDALLAAADTEEAAPNQGVAVTMLLTRTSALWHSICDDGSPTSLDLLATNLELISEDGKLDPCAKDFFFSGLWGEVGRATDQAAMAAHKLAYGPLPNEYESAKRSSGLGAQDLSAFDAMYREQMIEAFGDDLDEIRKDPSFTGSENDISRLIGIIDGSNTEAIFDDLAKGVALHSLRISRTRKRKDPSAQPDDDAKKQRTEPANMGSQLS